MINDLGNLELKSVSDLLKIMDEHLNSNRSRWIYRGQAKKDWPIIPSIGRLYKTKNFMALKKLYEFEKQAYSEFLIRNYSEFREGNNLINLAIAQHHGLNTRLLDWTFSPLFALFFAVENEDYFDKDGILLAYENSDGYNDYDSEKFDPLDSGSYNKDYYFIWAPSLTPRIKAQSGVFQIFKEPHVECSKPYNFHGIVIPAENKKSIKFELFKLGISYDSIYPEIDGVTKSINYYKLK